MALDTLTSGDMGRIPPGGLTMVAANPEPFYDYEAEAAAQRDIDDHERTLRFGSALVGESVGYESVPKALLDTLALTRAGSVLVRFSAN